jgi:serine/threonine protein kinase
MKAERWQQIEEFYHAALEREQEQRAIFLAEACGDDDALRREVESLLRFDERAERFIEAPALEVAAQLRAEEQSQSLIGRQLGPHLILSLLGAGGMGEVYRARDTRLDREVAVKVLPAHLAQDPQALSRFEREAKAVAALSHPNILAIHDFGTDQGVRYAVMELLEGETLRGRLTRSALAWREAAEVGAAVAEGLAAAHARGIIHRDLKPANIFLTTNGQVKILDFGIARVKQRAVAEAISSVTTRPETTTPGTVIGTVGYMSPEQVRGEKAEAPSDIFACGCVLYEMVTGRRAFARQTAAETIAAILTEDPPAPTGTGKDVPLELDRLIRLCLEKRPEDRFQSARDLALALKAIMSGSGMAQTWKGRAGIGFGTARAAQWIAVALIAVLVITILWWQPWQRRLSGSPQQHLISTFPGSHRATSFSPDGSMIAFISEVGGASQVWIKNLAQGDPLQITSGDLPAHRPRWSPKTDQILFSRGKGWAQDIWTVPPLGGTPRKIIERGRNPNWSWDGTRLVFEKDDQIWTAKADGTEQRKVEGVPPVDLLLAERMPAFSPDGSLIAFFQCKDGPPGDLWVIPSAGGLPRQLTFDDHVGGTPVWTPDGRFIVFSSMRSGSRTLWKIAATGGPPEPVLQGAGEDTDPDISRDGTRLIYTNTRNSFFLTIWNPATNQTRELKEARYDIVGPAFSPQGDKISFFEGVDEGDSHIFTINMDGSNLTQVTRGKGERNAFPRWSPDGEALFFYQIRPTFSFRKISLSGGPSAEIAPNWFIGVHYMAQVDPTGRRIAYTKREKGREVANIIREIETGKEMAFAPALRYLQWSKDGKSLLGADVSRNPPSRFGDILICPVEAGGGCRKVTKGSLPLWSGDESRIYFLRFGKTGGYMEVWSCSRDGQDEKLIGELRMADDFYSVSPKGEIVYVRFNQGKHELWLSDFPNP